ncbi:MAG: dehydratase [SAR202 cluster bacterium]|nr:dehydratase [SAR202 cluster bacterium]
MSTRKAGAILYFDDLRVGDLLPVLTKRPDTRQLVMYAGASDDYVPIHYDKDLAAEAGHQSVIVHGALKSAFLGQLVTDWMGSEGRIVELQVSYRGIDYPGDVLTCKGKVTALRREGTQNLVDCDIWLENGKGEVTTPGKAVVALPAR